MRAGIYLERFLFLFASVLWALYLMNVPAGYVAAAAALLLAGGAGGSLVLHRRSRSGDVHDDATPEPTALRRSGDGVPV